MSEVSVGDITQRIAELLAPLVPEGPSDGDEQSLMLRYVRSGRFVEFVQMTSTQFTGRFVDEQGSCHESRYILTWSTARLAATNAANFLQISAP